MGSEHVLREPCRALVVAIRSADVDATSTPEVIQEFAHARARRYGRSEAVALAREFAGLLSPLLVEQEEHLRPGLALYERHPGLGAFDAVLASVALAHGARALVSADRAFAGIDGLNHVVPGEDGFEALLRG